MIAAQGRASPGGGRAPFARAVLAHAWIELLLMLRRGESVLITLVVPSGLLLFFAALGLPGASGFGTIGSLLPGILALAVLASGLVSLGIATAFERQDGVLKRLGATPLTRGGLVLAKLLALLGVEAAQLGLLVAIASAYGWRPAGALGWALAALLLGTAAFAGLGLAMAGTLRAEATLAGANGLFLVFVLFGGMLFPLDGLPAWLAQVAHLLPAAALAETLRAALTPGAPVPGMSGLVLLAWAVAGPVVAARTFRWE
ncbi:MAG: ABC transporter permease [Chloroflexi bacterium]|nr:ABC transporter permease [Chloroflexota bacterium]